MSSLILWLITLLLFSVGLFGIFIPFIPGLGLIFVGVLVYAWATNFVVISVSTVVTFGVIAVIAWLAEYVGSGLAARLGGGKRYAFWGTTLGALIGTIAGPMGLMIGAFTGAFVGSLAEGQSTDRAGKIALWSVVGVLGVTFIQFLIGLAMIIAFFLAVLV
jgi:uncharacterized protein YqgC (DUF456 family)